ncbi:MAG: hypothetical protein HQL32_05940 [Planctomycetes bacterium]|nr:hypothetical protein [Planctomycetota bacterium]
MNVNSSLFFRNRIDHHQKELFSLIELLVMTSMIFLLASLMSTSLVKFHGQANAILCLNNLKKMIYITDEYISNHDNTLATVYVKGPVTNKWEHYGLRLYEDGLLDMNDLKSYSCPTTSWDQQDSLDYLNKKTYSINMFGLSRNKIGNCVSKKDAGTIDEERFLHLNQAPSPNDFLLYIDGKRSGKNSNFPQLYIKTLSGGSSWAASPWTVHDEDAAVTAAFLDGHVSLEFITDLQDKVHNKLEFVFAPQEQW